MAHQVSVSKGLKSEKCPPSPAVREAISVKTPAVTLHPQAAQGVRSGGTDARLRGFHGCVSRGWKRFSAGPSASDLQPQTLSLRPSASDLQPQTLSLRPSISDPQPQTCSLRPSASDPQTLRPSALDLQPQTLTLRPSPSDPHPQTHISP
uniref:Uncharacterized protein n=1 Tax=Knipowitschia caucasica TaxID=637954 RepID=A0AAV2J2L6_KNICA